MLVGSEKIAELKRISTAKAEDKEQKRQKKKKETVVVFIFPTTLIRKGD